MHERSIQSFAKQLNGKILDGPIARLWESYS
jgi:hypothetical protein